jgi:hypothetical protein
LALAVLGLAGAASAQDPPAQEPPFRPSNEQIDENLDRTLEREYDADHPPPPPDGGVVEAPPATEVHHDHDSKFKFHIGGYAAHLYSGITDVQVGKGRGSFNTPVRLDGTNAIADFDNEHAQTYKMWIDFGKHVSLVGGYRRSLFHSNGPSGASFTFDQLRIGRNEQLGITLDTLSADLDLVIKPINNRWVSIDLHLGSRYMFFRTELQGNRPDRTARSTLEAAVPVVGAGLAVRPFRWLELFARGRVGYLSYERPESNDRRGRGARGRFQSSPRREKTVKTGEIDIGMQFLIKETIGLVAGWRMDYMSFERRNDLEHEESRATVYGVYAGVVLQF